MSIGVIDTVNPHRFAPAIPDEEYVYGACAPGWHTAGTHHDALDDWIAHMQTHGIERICCLLPGRQLDDADANVRRYRAAFGESSVCHAPVPDHRLISRDRLHGDVLPFLIDARDAREPVLVHCLSGVGRTGQVLAAWLVYHYDYGPDRAIEAVRETGRDPAEAVQSGNAAMTDLIDLLSSVVRS